MQKGCTRIEVKIKSNESDFNVLIKKAILR